MQVCRNRAALALALIFSPLFFGAAAAAQETNEATMTLGRQVFNEGAQPACALCHTLADAGAAGEIGPILDQLKPGLDRARNAVTNGIGVMPAYGELLTPEQIEAVSVYVSEASGGAN